MDPFSDWGVSGTLIFKPYGTSLKQYYPNLINGPLNFRLGSLRDPHFQTLWENPGPTFSKRGYTNTQHILLLKNKNVPQILLEHFYIIC